MFRSIAVSLFGGLLLALSFGSHAEASAEPAADAVAAPAPILALPAAASSGWLARFFWSPQYCDRNRGSREPQCAPVRGFVLRDLIRIRDGKAEEGCGTGPVALRPDILNQILQYTLNLPETRASWRIYGRCSGLGEVDYAAYTELVDRRIGWPEKFSPEGPDVETTASDLLAAVAEANPELPVSAMSVHCRYSALESIDIRFDDSFNYVDRGVAPEGNCRAKIRMRGKR